MAKSRKPLYRPHNRITDYDCFLSVDQARVNLDFAIAMHVVTYGRGARVLMEPLLHAIADEALGVLLRAGVPIGQEIADGARKRSS